MRFFGKISSRRSQVRKKKSGERFSQIIRLVDTDSLISILLGLLFAALCIAAISFEDYSNLIQIAIIVILICVAAAIYIYHYQGRILKNHIQDFYIQVLIQKVRYIALRQTLTDL